MVSELQDKKMVQGENKVRGSGRKILIILAVIFVLPFGVAATLHLLQVKPGGHSYGELVKPPVSLKFPVLQDAQGKPFKAQSWQKIWNIVTIDTRGCTEACQSQLHLLKQVHISLGKEAHRVQRLLVLPVAMKGEILNALQKKYPDLIILVGADAETLRSPVSSNCPARQEDAFIWWIRSAT